MAEYEYPDDEQLKRITDWKVEWIDSRHPLYQPWFDYIKTLWWMPDWGWHEYDGYDGDEPIRVYHISTGGWSGNEDILCAMRQNFINYGQSFRQHRVGGHYEFWIPRKGARRLNRKPVASATSQNAEAGAVEGSESAGAQDSSSPSSAGGQA